MESSNIINRLAEEILVDHARKKNQVYLVTSAVDGEGVTQVCNMLCDAMRQSSPGKVHLFTVPKQEQELGEQAFEESPESRRAQFFVELKESYNIILIDAGGLLNRGRAMPFLEECQAAIIVTRAAKTRRGQVKETIAMLKRYSIPILGAVLNGVERVIPEALYKRL